MLDAGGAESLAASVHEEVEAAIRFAESSPVPAPEDALSGFYAHG